MERVLQLYKEFRKLVSLNMIQSDLLLNLLIDIYAECQGTLSKCGKRALTSKVVGKQYFSFTGKSGISRAINRDLYADGLDTVDSLFHLSRHTPMIHLPKLHLHATLLL